MRKGTEEERNEATRQYMLRTGRTQGLYSFTKRKEPIKCLICSKEIPRVSSKRKYCSMECSSESRRITTLDYMLIENGTTASHILKKRLIACGYFEAKCYHCGYDEWLDRPMPLELEHINGIHTDNRLENLTILCPNCHALTPTYRGKNIKK